MNAFNDAKLYTWRCLQFTFYVLCISPQFLQSGKDPRAFYRTLQTEWSSYWGAIQTESLDSCLFKLKGASVLSKASRKSVDKLSKHVGGAFCSVHQVALVFGAAQK